MGYKTVVSQMDYAEWLASRRHHIGASEISTVLGENRFGSWLRLWAEKVGRLEPLDMSDNEAVQMGLLLEQVVADHYTNKTGRKLEVFQTMIESEEYPWLSCTPDYTSNDGTEPVQIKTTSAYRLKEWADGVPPEVFWQLQQEMLVMGASKASVGVLVGGQKFMWSDVYADNKAQQRIIDESTEFWAHVQTNTYPDVDSNSSEVIPELFPVSAEGEEVALPHEAVDWDLGLLKLKSYKATLESEISELEAQIKLCIGQAETGYLHDSSARYTYKSQSRFSYSPLNGANKDWEDGDVVSCVVKKTNFRVLRRGEVK